MDSNHSTPSSISSSTVLGYMLQGIVEKSLDTKKCSYRSNVHYNPLFIRPDVFVGDPPTRSIHVTCSRGDNSLSMKRWRYVDEIFQVKSIYGNDCITINVMFGPKSELLDNDIALMNGLFDINVYVGDLDGGSSIHRESERLALKGESAAVGLDKVVKKGIHRKLLSLLGAELSAHIYGKRKSNWPERMTNDLVAYTDKRLKVADTYNHPPHKAAWKRTLLRLLCMPKHIAEKVLALDMAAISDGKDGDYWISRLKHLKLIRQRAGLIKKIEPTDELLDTLADGLDISTFLALFDRVTEDDRRKNELLDLHDAGERATASCHEFLEILRGGEKPLQKALSYSARFGGTASIEHHRAHLYDILICMLSLSQNRLQQSLPKISFGVRDPIRNMVPRTNIWTQAVLKDPGVVEVIAKETVKKHYEALSTSAISLPELVDKYIEYRCYCISKGSSIDPAEEIVNNYFQQSSIHPTGSCSITVDDPIVGKLTTRFSYSGETVDGRKIILKCLFGDTGADHKAEEMEARIRSIKLSAEHSEVIAIFLADGFWSENNIKSLLAGGYDYIAHFNSISDVLESI